MRLGKAFKFLCWLNVHDTIRLNQKHKRCRRCDQWWNLHYGYKWIKEGDKEAEKKFKRDLQQYKNVLYQNFKPINIKGDLQ